jgi:hypothetical protein
MFGKTALALHLLSLGTFVLIFVLFMQLLCLPEENSESSYLAFELHLGKASVRFKFPVSRAPSS